VQCLHHVEIDPQVVSICETHLRGVHRGVLSGTDARYQRFIADGAQWIEQARDKHEPYDVIILDLTDPGGPSRSLYDSDFYRLCAQVLQPQGALSLHIAAPWTQPDKVATTIAALREAFVSVRPYVASVPLSGGQWLMAVCAGQAFSEPTVPTLGHRLAGLKGPALKCVDATMLQQMLHLPPYLHQLLTAPPSTSLRTASFSIY
jgi:spermidine synthase